MEEKLRTTLAGPGRSRAKTLDLTPDEVLTTTRAVRRRLDLERPVPRHVVEECLEIALQAPNGSNQNAWRWIAVDDGARIERMAAIYNAGLDDYVRSLGEAVGENYVAAAQPGFERMQSSVQYLRDHLHEAPVLVLPLFAGRTPGGSLFLEASLWGSIVQAVWSLMLALRVRGLGSCWTTGHLHRHEEMAALLRIPAEFTQVGLFPIAYTKGTEFKPGWRRPAEEVLRWNDFKWRKDA
jgi:nitroreductase